MKKTELKQLIKEMIGSVGYVDLLPVGNMFLREADEPIIEDPIEEPIEEPELAPEKSQYVVFKKHIDRKKVKLTVYSFTDSELEEYLKFNTVYFITPFRDFERAFELLSEEGDAASIRKIL